MKTISILTSHKNRFLNLLSENNIPHKLGEDFREFTIFYYPKTFDDIELLYLSKEAYEQNATFE